MLQLAAWKTLLLTIWGVVTVNVKAERGLQSSRVPGAAETAARKQKRRELASCAAGHLSAAVALLSKQIMSIDMMVFLGLSRA